MPAINSAAHAQDFGSVVTTSTLAKIKEPTLMTGHSALTAKDVQVLCRALNLPLPTPDVTFADILQMAGMTDVDAYSRLMKSTNIDVMIATNTLRKGITKLPDDKRLDPEPHRKPTAGATTSTKSSSTPRMTRSQIDDIGNDAVLEAVAECPSKAGSNRAQRFALYRIGATVGELLESGVRAKDLRRHLADGTITVRQP